MGNPIKEFSIVLSRVQRGIKEQGREVGVSASLPCLYVAVVRDVKGISPQAPMLDKFHALCYNKNDIDFQFQIHSYSEATSMQRRGGYQTKQKSQILEYFEKHANAHLTAAELVQALTENGTPIGAATVYRTLERLETEGLVRRYTLDERGGACWQYAGAQTEAQHCHAHFHLKCIECGALLHVDCEYLQGIGKHILAHHGFVVDHSRTVLYGLCEHCREKK